MIQMYYFFPVLDNFNVLEENVGAVSAPKDSLSCKYPSSLCLPLREVHNGQVEGNIISFITPVISVWHHA